MAKQYRVTHIKYLNLKSTYHHSRKNHVKPSSMKASESKQNFINKEAFPKFFWRGTRQVLVVGKPIMVNLHIQHDEFGEANRDFITINLNHPKKHVGRRSLARPTIEMVDAHPNHCGDGIGGRFAK